MIDKPDNGINTGLFGNGDPCSLVGIWERTPPVPHNPRSSTSSPCREEVLSWARQKTSQCREVF